MKNFIVKNGIENNANRGNCLVLALAAATGEDYKKVENFCRWALKYKEGRGCSFEGNKSLTNMLNAGYLSEETTKVANYKGRQMSARKFVEGEKSGNWVVITNGHAFAVLASGEVVDNGFSFEPQKALKNSTLKGQYVKVAIKI
jgi:hypothetical protein